MKYGSAARLDSTCCSSAAANPYYNPYNSYNYPYGYSYAPAPAQAYYRSTPYYPQRSCWDAYYRRYYAC